MKNIIFLLFLAIFAFAIIGWFLDWYAIADVRSDGGRHQFQIDIDANKIRQDIDKGQSKLQGTINRIQHPADVGPLPEMAQPPVQKTEGSKQ